VVWLFYPNHPEGICRGNATQNIAFPMLNITSPGCSVAVLFVSFAHRFFSQLFLSIHGFAQAILGFAPAPRYLAFLCQRRPTLFRC
jgi:hypothetical protein